LSLTARTDSLSFFQNPAHDREYNPHAILIRIFFYPSETVKRVRIRFENIRYSLSSRAMRQVNPFIRR